MKLPYLPIKLREGLRYTFSSKFTVVECVRQCRMRTTRPRNFTTSRPFESIKAAPEIDFNGSKNNTPRFRLVGEEGDDNKNDDNKMEDDEIFYGRLVPESRSYFTVQPTFTDNLIHLEKVLQEYKLLPVVAPGDVPKVAWISGRDYKNAVGERVKNSRYQGMLRTLKRLHQIHPSMMPKEVGEAIKHFKRDVVPEAPSMKIPAIDELGRTLGLGKRKRSTGRAWLVEGTGEVLVNGKTLAEAFSRVQDRETVLWPLKTTGRLDKYNLWCRAEGGGTTGQAEALTLAVAKALLGHEPALKPALRRAGCVTRDPRKVERKKPGHVKARKMPAWVKR